MGMRRTRWAAAAAAIAAAALATVGPAGAQNAATTPEPIAGTGCEEHEAWVDGDAAAVAARLPKRYTAFTDANGAPLVFARAMRCQAENVGGQAAPVTIADWGVVIDTPDGMGCGSGTPSFPAEYVPDLVYRLGAADGSGQTPFHFVAPGWTI